MVLFINSLTLRGGGELDKFATATLILLAPVNNSGILGYSGRVLDVHAQMPSFLAIVKQSLIKRKKRRFCNYSSSFLSGQAQVEHFKRQSHGL